MSYVLLHADRLHSVVVDDPLIPAAEVGSLRDAASLLAEVGRLRESAQADIAAARAAAQEAGLAAARDEARTTTADRMTEALARLEIEAEARAAQHRGDVARLAIEVVRRIAGELPQGVLVAALAEQAASALSPPTGMVVRVAPAAADMVRERLAGSAGMSVEADPALGETDCVLETPLGRTLAGLDTQLAAIERAWVAG